MDGNSDTTSCALLQELLAAQHTLLQEVRESKDQINVLSSRLSKIEEHQLTSGFGQIESARSHSGVGSSTDGAVKAVLESRDLDPTGSSNGISPSTTNSSVLTDAVLLANVPGTFSADEVVAAPRNASKSPPHVNELGGNTIQHTAKYEDFATPCRKPLKRVPGFTESVYGDKIDLTGPSPDSFARGETKTPRRFATSSSSTKTQLMNSSASVPITPPTSIKKDQTTPLKKRKRPAESTAGSLAAKRNWIDLTTPPPESSISPKTESPERSAVSSTDTQPRPVNSKTSIPPPPICTQHEPKSPRMDIAGPVQPIIEAVKTRLGLIDLETPLSEPSVHTKVESPQQSTAPPVVSVSHRVRSKTQALALPSSIKVNKTTPQKRSAKSLQPEPLSDVTPLKKRRKPVVEVCIRMDESARRARALAGSFDDVIKALQRNAERSKRMLEKQVDYWDEAPEPQGPQIKRRKLETDPKHDGSSNLNLALPGSSRSERKSPTANGGPPKPQAANAELRQPGPPVPIQPKVDAKDIKPDIGRPLFDDESIRRRLTGYVDFPVDLSSPARNALVTRAFMSETYGGSPMQFCPTISPERRLALGGHDHHFLFPHLGHNPHAPQRPGQVGLLCRSGDEAPWGQRAMKLLVRIRDGMWWYMGEYKTVRSEPLSRAEFVKLGKATKKAWASTVRKRKKRHDVEIRARVVLRRKLGREPTQEDLQQAFAMETKFNDVTVDEIIRSYEDGLERIYIWCFKCVGYDDDFQHELAQKFSVFVPRQ